MINVLLLLSILALCSATGFKEKDLLAAAEVGDIATLDEIIQEGNLDLEMKYKDETPLHVAASNGQVAFAAKLLDNGVFVDVKDYLGYRPITMATLSGSASMVRLLASRGADLYIMDDVDDKKYMLLEKAAALNNVDVLRLLLELGMDINSVTDDDNTALIMSSLYGHIDAVKLLIDAGASLELRNSQGNTALMAATFKGHSAVVRELLRAGASPNAYNNDKVHPVVLAARSNFPKVLRELLKEGGEVNVVDKFNNSPLSLCARSNHMDCVNQLLARNANMEVVDSTGQTALHYTYVNNHKPASKALTLAGASHGAAEGHNGIPATNIPKVPVCYWFRGILKRFGLSQKQTRGDLAGRKACAYLAEELNLRGSMVKLLDMISFYGYKATVDRLNFDIFQPESGDGSALEDAKRAARGDLKNMHSKDYREHFRQTDEDVMEKNLPSMLRKFGADIPEEPKEDDLSLADIASEKTIKRQVHRASPADRPEHFKESAAAPKKADLKSRESFLKRSDL